MTRGDNSGETERLLPSSLAANGGSNAGGKSNLAKLRTYFAKPVDLKRTDLVLLACFFISGLIDSASYNAYECFTSMQTGNTIFIALGVSHLPVSSPNLAWTKSLTAVSAFFLGSFLLSTFHRHFGSRTRGALTASFLLQTTLIAIAAGFVRDGRTSSAPRKGTPPEFLVPTTLPSDPGFPWPDLIPIALLSFQAATKVVASRMLELNPLPAIVLTTLYCDLMSDPGLFTAGLLSNTKRNQRVASVLVYFLGAVLGGAAASSWVGFTGALIGAAVLQGCLVVAWIFWKEDTREDS